jgi:integrase
MTPETLLTDVLDDYFRSNIRIRCPRTRDHYKLGIRMFGESLGHSATLGDLTDDNATAFIHWSLNDGYNEHTANQRVKQIRALWNWLAKRRLVEQFPTFHDALEPEPAPTAWTVEELHQIFDTCARQPGFVGQHFASTWWLAIHHWWLSSAERTEATMLLERSMVNLDKRVARVPASIRKGGRKNQFYTLSDRCCELFDTMFRVPSQTGLVFDHGWKHWHSIYGHYRKFVLASGLPYVRGKSGPKKMRVTVYTMMEARGLDPSKFARHSSRAVTQHYIDQGELQATKKTIWPPTGFNPEEQPVVGSKNWRTFWGLLGGSRPEIGGAA